MVNAITEVSVLDNMRQVFRFYIIFHFSNVLSSSFLFSTFIFIILQIERIVLHILFGSIFFPFVVVSNDSEL